MKIIYGNRNDGICILRCFGYDGQVELPKEIHGTFVTELGPYLFSETVRRQEPGRLYFADLSEEEAGNGFTGENGNEQQEEREQETLRALLRADALADGTPALKGMALRSLSLPEHLKKIGAYACYNCGNLEFLEFFGALKDLGAGLFTGCHRMARIHLHMEFGETCCLKEVLAELRQTLRVAFIDQQGTIWAKLLFPEYYEESIENTPARILTQEMHGCGHRYRNAFSGKEFQYWTYDKLFPHIQVQEKPELVTELVMGRLMYPVQLKEDRKRIYEEYSSTHGREILRVAQKQQDMDLLKFAAASSWCSEECLEEMLEEGGCEGNAQALGILMDIRYQKKENSRKKGKNRFTL
ncbi:MAG: leucine-rich repeat protein [Lachnospiraceae bacterium]|jgi:hypothetical protein|nr:leucine-rich repeat protein [Lachnospiraceae bacterium]